MKRLLIFLCILMYNNAVNMDFLTPDEIEKLREKVPGYYPVSRNQHYKYPVHMGKFTVDVKNIILNGVTQFALNIDDALSEVNTNLVNGNVKGNVVFSPVSLAGNLALILLAAKGNTFQEISQTLGLALNAYEYSALYFGEIHKTFGQLLAMIEKNDSSVQTTYANGVFVKNYQIQSDFVWNSNSMYKADIIALNFITSEIAKQTLNTWVNDKTRGKISEIVTDNLKPQTNIIFASALYFNGEWNNHFLDYATKQVQFKIEADQSVDVDMMYNANKFPFYESKKLGVKMLGIPYKNSNVTMYVLLPTVAGSKALRQFKKTLNPLIIEDLIKEMKTQECIIAIPKMKLSSVLHMKETLQSLGIKSLFNDADLSSGFIPFKNHENGYSGLVVEDVLHSVEITINEKGTEAAAASIASTIDRMNDKKKFIANRPFIFFIRDDITKLMLFWGTINNPAPNFQMDDISVQ